MKLHVGCGRIKLDGYQHLDIVEFPHVDYCCPAWDVPVSDGIFDEVYSRHLFEHFYPWEANDSMREWRRILKDDGKLKMILPDLEYSVKQLFWEGMSGRLTKKTNQEHAMANMYGWVSEGKLHMAHHWGYTQKTLSELVLKYFDCIEFNDCQIGDLAITAWGKK